ncbi:MAG: hypothetical protein ACKOB1_04930 [Planctomycetia bacterium]
MRYTVLCDLAAEQQLAAAYLAAADRSLVSAAARGIEEILSEAPLAFGESRHGDQENIELRVGFEPPLAVWYTVCAADRTVVIVRFRLCP